MSRHEESQPTDWGAIDERGVAAIERAIGRSIAAGLEEFLSDPERVARVMTTVFDVASKRGAEESGRWLWKQLAGAAWWVAKGFGIVAIILWAGGGWPAVAAFLKIKTSGG